VQINNEVTARRVRTLWAQERIHLAGALALEAGSGGLVVLKVCQEVAPVQVLFHISGVLLDCGRVREHDLGLEGTTLDQGGVPEKMLCQVHAVRLIAVRATHDGKPLDLTCRKCATSLPVHGYTLL